MSGFSFDAQAALKGAREAHQHANPANPANPGPSDGRRLARLAGLAPAHPSKPQNAPRQTDPEIETPRPRPARFTDHPYGLSVAGNPRTWTGRIVTPEAWAQLSEWDRHGPNGRLWCGLCEDWHLPGECGSESANLVANHNEDPS